MFKFFKKKAKPINKLVEDFENGKVLHINDDVDNRQLFNKINEELKKDG